jgi:hypothetical protein
MVSANATPSNQPDPSMSPYQELVFEVSKYIYAQAVACTDETDTASLCVEAAEAIKAGDAFVGTFIAWKNG